MSSSATGRLTGGERALYLADTSGLFRILQDKLRRAWADELAAGVIATCSVVELEFLFSDWSPSRARDGRRILVRSRSQNPSGS